MIAAQTKRSRMARRRPRADIDPKALRYFVYRVHDAAGQVLYIGRSCDVAARLRAHYSDATHPAAEIRERKTWVFSARRVSMVGPYTWDEACRVERREIETHQPSGNRTFTEAHGWPRRFALSP